MSSARIVNNTCALFMRQFAILGINLYAVRITLSELGIDDYALFNVISSIVAISSFLPLALAGITQRYFAFAIGGAKDDSASLKRIYDASLLLCVGVSILVLIGLETVGAWFVAHELVIPPGRFMAAQITFQLTIFSFIATNFVGFYVSIVQAHEDMPIYAALSVLEGLLRLGAAVALSQFDDGLIGYTALICLISIGMAGLYWVLCIRRYAECRWARFRIEIATLREMSGFAGWTIFGQITTICRNQAVTILVNQAFNPVTVAARALAVTVSAQALIFSTNFSAALHPPIIKSHAAGEHEKMFSLVFAGARIAFFLIWVVTLPLIALMPMILHLWLSSFPPEAILFTRLALIENAVMAISLTLMTAVRAAGKMRLYELSLGFLQAVVLLMSWLLIRVGSPAYSVYLVAIAINLVMFAVRLAVANRMIGLSARAFLRSAGIPVSLVAALSSALVLAVLGYGPNLTEFRFQPNVILAAGLICLLPVGVIYAAGMSASERRSLHGMIRQRLSGFGASS